MKSDEWWYYFVETNERFEVREYATRLPSVLADQAIASIRTQQTLGEYAACTWGAECLWRARGIHRTIKYYACSRSEHDATIKPTA